jgi:hypothetical protein
LHACTTRDVDVEPFRPTFVTAAALFWPFQKYRR